MKPLKITAWLAHGFTAQTPWTPSIDGIVAAAVMRERLGPDRYRTPPASGLEPVEGLPFDVIRHGDHWWYAASSPIIVGAKGREKKFFHRRFDDNMERFLPEGTKRVQTGTGSYKASRLYDVRVVCRGLRWHAVGDPAEVERLVNTIDQVGGRRAVGFGRVLSWEVSEDGDPRIARGHRPLPVELQEIQDAVVLPWGLVPPVRCSSTDCVMPEERHDAA